MAASDANLLIASATNSSALGICTGASFNYDANFVKVRGEGVTGPSAVGMDKSDFMAEISFLVGPARTVNASPASLVIVVKKMDGTTSVTYTITSMKPGGYRYVFNRDNAPAEWSQTFQHVGDMATDPQSQA